MYGEQYNSTTIMSGGVIICSLSTVLIYYYKIFEKRRSKIIQLGIILFKFSEYYTVNNIYR